MKPILYTLLFSLTYCAASAQHPDKRIIDENVRQANPEFNITPNTIYVIDGLPYMGADSTKLDSVLSGYRIRYLLGLDLLICARSPLLHCNNDAILISFVYPQKNKIRKRLLKNARALFADKYQSFSQHILTNSKDPVLYIDNSLVHPTEVRERVYQLRKKDIYHIIIDDKPQPATMYGQNSKNGLVRIWTIRR